MRVTGLYLLCALLFVPCGVSAQTVQLQSFLVEYRIDTFGWDLSWYSQDLSDQLQGGVTELRQQIQYDAPAHRLVVWTFSVPALSPPITPMLQLQDSPFEKYRVNLDRVEESGPGIAFVGIVTDNAVAPLTEVSTGGSFFLSADYFSGNAPEIRNVRLIINQQERVYMPVMPGRAEVSARTNHSPVIVATPDFDTLSSEVFLDASQTTDPDGDNLDFKWHLITGAASLRGCETPTPVFQISSGRGLYQFLLTVTDSRGSSSEKLIQVNYDGR